MPGGKYTISVMAFLLLLIPSLLVGQASPFLSYEVQPGAGCTVLIRWEASATGDTLNYELERSSDKQNWKVIAREPVRKTHKYIVFDTKPDDSLNYYRVKQVSNKNPSAYSPVKCVQLVRAFEIFLWPNPSTDVLYVMSPFMTGSMDIFDATGILVRKIVIVDFTTSISTIGLAAGIYFLHIRHADIYTVQQFIKE